MTTLQRERLEECIIADSRRLIAMCRRMASRKSPGYGRTRLAHICECLELLVEQAEQDDGEFDDLPETY